MVHFPDLRTDYIIIIMTSWHARRYFDNYWSAHLVTYIKQKHLILAKQQKRPHINIFICIEMEKHYRRVVNRKHGQYSHWGAFFVKLVLFQMFIFKKKIMNKWQHVAYKKYHSSSTICEKSQVDVFKITPTGSSQKRGIKNTVFSW